MVEVVALQIVNKVNSEIFKRAESLTSQPNQSEKNRSVGWSLLGVGSLGRSRPVNSIFALFFVFSPKSFFEENWIFD